MDQSLCIVPARVFVRTVGTVCLDGDGFLDFGDERGDEGCDVEMMDGFEALAWLIPRMIISMADGG